MALCNAVRSSSVSSSGGPDSERLLNQPRELLLDRPLAIGADQRPQILAALA